MLQDCYEASAADNDGDPATEGAVEHEQARSSSILRPPDEIGRNVWFALYWAWLVSWNEHPLKIAVGLAIIAFFGAANVYFHWLRPILIN